MITSFKFSPNGNLVYNGTSFRTIASQVSLTMTQTVHLAIPIRWAIVWYSEGVARTQSVITTCLGTNTGLLITLVSFCISGFSSSKSSWMFHGSLWNCPTNLLAWKFVALHHPPIRRSRMHANCFDLTVAQFHNCNWRQQPNQSHQYLSSRFWMSSMTTPP